MKMKKIKGKITVWFSILLLCGQYALVAPQVVQAVEAGEETVQQMPKTTMGVQGIPTVIGKMALKFITKQAIKYTLLEMEKVENAPLISSMASAALSYGFSSTVILRELDQIQNQLKGISEQIDDLSATMTSRLAQMDIQGDITAIQGKRDILFGISDAYTDLSKSYKATIKAYQVYVENGTSQNYQKFYKEYKALTMLMGGDNPAEVSGVNFEDDLNKLLKLLAPTREDGGDQKSSNYLFSVQEYATKTFAFRHQAYDVMAASFEEIVGYALNYLMAYRTYTTIRVENNKNKIYSTPGSPKNPGDQTREDLVSEIGALQENYQEKATQLLEAIEASAKTYLEPIIGDYLAEDEQQVDIQMNYLKERKTQTHGVAALDYTERAIDTVPVAPFYRVRPIGSEDQFNEGQPLGNQTKTYYILNHLLKKPNESVSGKEGHRIYGLGGVDSQVKTNDFYFVNGDFFNLRVTKDTNINAKLLPNPQAYKELFSMPSYSLAENNFPAHLANTGELRYHNIVGNERRWLFDYYTKPYVRNYGTNIPGDVITARIDDAYIGLMDAGNIDKEKAYTDEEIRVQVDDLAKETFAQPDRTETYLTILQGEKEEAYNLEDTTWQQQSSDLPLQEWQKELLTFEVAQDDYGEQGRVISGSPITIKVNFPEEKAKRGHKYEVTRLVKKTNDREEELYSNRISSGAGTQVLEANFEVPTEFLTTMPYGNTEIYVEYEQVKKEYTVSMIDDDGLENLLPGYATFVSESYLQDKAVFDENVEVHVSPREGYVVSGVEVTKADGSKFNATLVDAKESGIPSFGGGVFRFAMPDSAVSVKPIYEKGIVVDLTSKPKDDALKNNLTFVAHNLWDTNILDDTFDGEGKKIQPILTRGTFRAESEFHFTAKNTDGYALKNLVGREAESSTSDKIPLNESGEYHVTLPKMNKNGYMVTANYLPFEEATGVILESTGEGIVNFAGISSEVDDLPFADGDPVKVEITPEKSSDFDGSRLAITLNGEPFSGGEINDQLTDKEGNPRYLLSFEKQSGLTEINVAFTEENLVQTETTNGRFYLKDRQANRGLFAPGEKVHVQLSSNRHFVKESLKFLVEGKRIETPADVTFDETGFSFTKPDTTKVITLKGTFDQSYGISKVIEEIGDGQNELRVLAEDGREIDNSYEGDLVTVSTTEASRAKLVQLQIVGETSGQVTIVDLTKDLTFEMPQEAVRIEASFDNQGRAGKESLPQQNIDGAYVLTSYEEFVKIGKLMNLPLKSNSYQRANYVLEATVDFKKQPWTPWGSEQAPFNGVLEGNGFGIVNLNLVGAGLIEAIGKEGKVQNISVLSVEATKLPVTQSFGVITGNNQGLIDNVTLGLAKEVTHVRVGEEVIYPRETLNQTVTQNCDFIGSVVGKNYGTIQNVTNYLTLKVNGQGAREGAGGIAGKLFKDSRLVNSLNVGAFEISTGNSGFGAGGLADTVQESDVTMENNYTYPTILGPSFYYSPSVVHFAKTPNAMETNYYVDLGVKHLVNQGTPISGEAMRSDSFVEKLNAGVRADAGYKSWTRAEQRNDGLPYLDGGQVVTNQLATQDMTGGIFTVTSQVPFGTELLVQSSLKGKAPEIIKDAVKNGKIEKLVDLSLQHPEVKVKIYGETKIKIDITQFESVMENREFKLLHLAGERLEEVDLVQEGHYLVGQVNSLSPFALVSIDKEDDLVLADTPADTEGGKSGMKLPQTGEEVALSLTFLGLSLCIGLWLYAKKRRLG